jgi:thiamine-phosphate pyrophosphorylase
MSPRTFRVDGVYGFYPIVDTAERVEWLLDLGVRTVQIRNKTLSGNALRDELGRAVAAGERADAQVVVNDYAEDALAVGARFLHLGQTDLEDVDVDALLEAGIGLGISSHSPGERDRALDLSPSYIALGPLYETTLKRMKFAPQGLERLQHWKMRAQDVPVVGIGGVSLERAPDVLAAGADSIAVVSDLDRDGPDGAEARVAGWLALFGGQQ